MVLLPTVDRNKRQDSPMLWLSVLAGSLALHLVLLLIGHWYFSRPQGSPSGSATPIEIAIAPNSDAATAERSSTVEPNSPANKPSTATTPIEPQNTPSIARAPINSVTSDRNRPFSSPQPLTRRSQQSASPNEGQQPLNRTTAGRSDRRNSSSSNSATNTGTSQNRGNSEATGTSNSASQDPGTNGSTSQNPNSSNSSNSAKNSNASQNSNSSSQGPATSKTQLPGELNFSAVISQIALAQSGSNASGYCGSDPTQPRCGTNSAQQVKTQLDVKRSEPGVIQYPSNLKSLQSLNLRVHFVLDNASATVVSVEVLEDSPTLQENRGLSRDSLKSVAEAVLMNTEFTVTGEKAQNSDWNASLQIKLSP